jgi:hypothetical protein
MKSNPKSADIPDEVKKAFVPKMGKAQLEKFWFFPHHSLCGRSPESAWQDGAESQQLIRDLLAERTKK